MPIETFAFIDSLNPAYPGHTDPLSEADSHLRGIKQTLKSTFPNVNGAVTATDEGLNASGTAFSTAGTVEIAANGTTLGGVLRLDGVTAGNDVVIYNTGTVGGPPGLAIHLNQGTTVALPALTISPTGTVGAYAALDAPSIKKAGNELVPSGLISMWFGSLASIPAGWVLCDGANSTPDLRNRFVLGAGGAGYSGPGTVGGNFTAAASTSTAGGHAHGSGTGAGGAYSITPGTTAAGQHAHGTTTAGYALTANDLPPHQHQVPGMIVGGSTAGQNYVGLGSDQSLSGVTSSGSVQNTSVTSTVGAGFAHVHGISQDGSHSHVVPIVVGDHGHSISLDGSHSHTVSVSSTPPYYALAYIMKT